MNEKKKILNRYQQGAAHYFRRIVSAKTKEEENCFYKSINSRVDACKKEIENYISKNEIHPNGKVKIFGLEVGDCFNHKFLGQQNVVTVKEINEDHIVVYVNDGKKGELKNIWLPTTSTKDHCLSGVKKRIIW